MKKEVLLNEAKSIGVSRKIAEKVLQKKADLSRQQFFLAEEIDFTKAYHIGYRESLKQIAFGYPLEYILESAEFYGRDFFVDKRCLIPRDDTELMVDMALSTLKTYSGENEIILIDVGTGSGAIPISIALDNTASIEKQYAVDISPDALEVAQKNISQYHLGGKISLLQSNLLESLGTARKNKHYIITANLPYIKDQDYGNIDKSVILHEPSVALYGGKETGFELYEKLIMSIIEDYSVHNSVELFIEIGFDQIIIAENFLEEKALKYQSFRDILGVERCIHIIFPFLG